MVMVNDNGGYGILNGKSALVTLVFLNSPWSDGTPISERGEKNYEKSLDVH